jgi:hypothetical protein
MKDPLSHAFGKDLPRLLEAANSEMKRKVLKARRDLLFAQFLRSPWETHLAIEIKCIDDQVAECAEQIQQERDGRK